MPFRISRFYQDEGRKARSEPVTESEAGRLSMLRVTYMSAIGRTPYGIRRVPVGKENAPQFGAIIGSILFLPRSIINLPTQ